MKTQRIRRLYAFAAVAAVSSCTTWCAISINGTLTPASPVLLTSDLPRLTVEISPAFDKRIQARFPVGSSDEAMGRELQSEGFQRSDWTTQPDRNHQVYRTEFGFPCRKDFFVNWQADAQGRLTAIDGFAGVTCL